MTDKYTDARLKYKPNKVKTLFIGESPPAKGDYFYFGGNNNLLRYIRQAFISVYGYKCGVEDEFLSFFKENDYYIIDLCENPINWETNKQRRQLRKDNVDSLANRVKNINPASVIVFMKGIEEEVSRALEKSDLNIPNDRVFITRFPGFGNQLVSVQQIADALIKLVKL